ncbi:MAG: helix-turn-helix domain-containing protein [Thermosediminibacteraceae bacterium]|nr:helix-turn-helix domain-containing protein [Thermosediminibacteraceae bacterium]
MLKLKQVRLEKGFSQTQLAALAGIHPATLSKLENGKVFPYPAWRKKLAKALDWPEEKADELFTEVEE